MPAREVRPEAHFGPLFARFGLTTVHPPVLRDAQTAAESRRGVRRLASDASEAACAATQADRTWYGARWNTKGFDLAIVSAQFLKGVVTTIRVSITRAGNPIHEIVLHDGFASIDEAAAAAHQTARDWIDEQAAPA